MGRFNKEMGLHGIIEMFPSLLNRKEDSHLVLAGASGELVGSAKELQEIFPEKVTIMNDIPFDLQPSLYAASDIVLAPSRDKHACMGVSIKEAMAAGLPVIASDSGGIPEAIIHNETGIIIPLQKNGENNLKEYEEAIVTLSLNKERRRQLGENALNRAKKIFSEEETLDKTFEVFKKNVPAQ
jgi:spore coat protein SA